MFTIRVSSAGVAGDPMKLLVAECSTKDLKLTESYIDSGGPLGCFNMCRAKKRLKKKFVTLLCSVCYDLNCSSNPQLRGNV